MKASTIKTYTSVHTWTGLGMGMVLFIAFYAGALTMFLEDIGEWAERGAHAEEVYGGLTQAQTLVDALISARPEAADSFTLHLGHEQGHGHRIYWYELLEDGRGDSHSFRLSDGGELLPIDATSVLPGFINELHFTAGLPSSISYYTLGIACMIYSLALITGLIVFTPNFLKDLFIIRSPRNPKRFWLDTHNVVGVISLPWHFMFALSSFVLTIGFVVALPIQTLALPDLGLDELAAQSTGRLLPPPPANVAATMLPVDELIERASSALAGLEPSDLTYHHAGDQNGTVQVLGRTKGDTTLMPRSAVMLSVVTGHVIDTFDPRDGAVGPMTFNGLLALHFGNYGGYVVRWTYFLLGLAGAFLFYSGNLLWIERHRKRRQPEQKKDARWFAKLNSGVCIGCMAGVSAAFLAARPTPPAVDQAHAIELAYFGVFFLSIGWCLVRPVAAGARDMLYVTATLTALIPIVDTALFERAPWQAAMQAQQGVLAVQLVATLGTLGFWRLGKLVERRGMEGDPNSVWALPGGSDQRRLIQTDVDRPSEARTIV